VLTDTNQSAHKSCQIFGTNEVKQLPGGPFVAAKNLSILPTPPLHETKISFQGFQRVTPHGPQKQWQNLWMQIPNAMIERKLQKVPNWNITGL
jgi:hypothetical protein